MLNYLFCLDQNYNKQLLTTLNSLNLNSTSKFNVYIIHSYPESLYDLIEKNKIIFDNINKFQVFKYLQNNHVFPNIENSHVSEATYYRFFLEDYIKEEVDYLIYLDCDILCLNNPTDILTENIRKLDKSNFMIAASTEYIHTPETSELFNRLELKGNQYFNAGVILINYQMWKSNNLKHKLLSTMKLLHHKINFWDQDILNHVFDGDYLTISNNLNFFAPSEKERNSADLRSVIFLHFAGSNKPWKLQGALMNISREFHKNYSSIFPNKYLIVTNYRKKALFDLTKNLVNLKILKLESPIDFIKQVVKSLKA
jgi:lipopolysaccharide biosynthesis glycosyltransferase